MSIRRRVPAALATVAVLAAVLSIAHPSREARAGSVRARASAAGSGADFNGDGFADLAAGSNESVGETNSAGGVNVLYGGAGGLGVAGDQFWSLNSPGVPGVAEEDGFFGTALAAGDFNGDGRSDLAAAATFEDVGTVEDAGVVLVLSGSTTGLKSAGAQLWTQNSPGIPGMAAAGGRFGAALATGNFGRGPEDDLAVGALDRVGGKIHAGSATIIYGGPHGLASSGAQRWTQDSPNVKERSEPEDGFGSELAAGDLGSGALDDLAIGAQQEDVGAEGSEIEQAGVVHVLYGSASGLTASKNQLWSQASPDLFSTPPEVDDRFGSALAIGNFGHGRQGDLIVGIPHEDGGAADSGQVQVIYGSAAGLTGDESWFIGQGVSFGLQDAEEAGDQFGFSLAVGDFGSGPQQDLAVGVFGEGFAGADGAGAVAIVYGTTGGLDAPGNQLWAQTSSPDILDTSEADDGFGLALAAGNFGGNPHDDLAVGVPNEGPPSRSGVVNSLYSDGSSLGAAGNELWSQDVTHLEGNAEAEDRFGWSLT